MIMRPVLDVCRVMAAEDTGLQVIMSPRWQGMARGLGLARSSRYMQHSLVLHYTKIVSE